MVFLMVKVVVSLQHFPHDYNTDPTMVRVIDGNAGMNFLQYCNSD